MRFLATIAVSGAVLAFAGCAMISAKAPDPDRPRDQPPMCNDAKGGVVLDALMATAFGVGTIAIAADGGGDGAAITALGTLAYGVSASVGNSSANKCRAATEEYTAMREKESVEAAFMRQGGGSVNAPGGIPVDEEDATVASIPPPAKPRPVVAPPPQPQPQPAPQPQPQPRPEAKARPSADEGDWSDFWKEVP
jgi:hypothetical protein